MELATKIQPTVVDRPDLHVRTRCDAPVAAVDGSCSPQTEVPEDDAALHEAVLHVVRECIPALHVCRDRDFHVAKVAGGITNNLFRLSVSCDRIGAEALSLTDGKLSVENSLCVLVRVYGEGSEHVIDRRKDIATYRALAHLGFAPPLYAVFGNGRVEGFLHHVRPLEPYEMRRRGILEAIAVQTARMHSLRVHTDTGSGPRPHAHAMAEDAVEEPCMLNNIQTWMRDAATLSFDDPHMIEQFRRIDFEALLGELRRYAAHVQAQAHARVTEHTTGGADTAGHPDSADVGSEDALARFARELMYRTVFAHNDLLSGNVLVPACLPVEGSDADASAAVCEHLGAPRPVCAQLRLIDYEYGGYNYAGFDVANHLCEHAGFEFDIERDFPSPADQDRFLSAYATAILREDSRLAAPATDLDATETIARLAPLMRGHLGPFVLGSHLWWAAWALLQAAASRIDFDYLGYAIRRLSAFQMHRPVYWTDGPAIVRA